MAINNKLLSNAARNLEKNLPDWLKAQNEANYDAHFTEDMVNIVNKHALGAATAGIGCALLPGAGSGVALAAMVGFVWSMYYRLNKRIGLKLSKVLVKSLASAILSNLTQSALSVVGTVALSTILSMTGIGVIASSTIMASLDYAVVLVGGIIYLKLMTRLFAAGRNPQEMTQTEFSVEAGETIASESIKDLLKQSRKNYSDAKKNGEVTGAEKVTLVDE